MVLQANNSVFGWINIHTIIAHSWLFLANLQVDKNGILSFILVWRPH